MGNLKLHRDSQIGTVNVMVRQVTEEPGPSRPRFQTVRRARNSKNDVPCGENCLIYPKGKVDHTPDGFLGKVARYLELDLKTRPSRKTWVERKGERRRRGGRHVDCERPNRFHPAEDGEGGEELLDVDADEGGEGEGEGGERVFPPVPPALPAGEVRPADEVAWNWRRLDEERRARPEEVRAMIAGPGQMQEWRRAIESGDAGRLGPTGRIETFHVRRVRPGDGDDPVVPPPRTGLIGRIVPFRLARRPYPFQ
ncbi:hypothetical protein CkaCkLH20_04556 [Colletotrichum karsti]|uniref:Uncharacterized protein n=1 Tax=Colletotrichum karsti TaxID=1095194 RepID=A0A9P6LM50_9PEZI|nr:uncharacterized protein CkaCkLH20_04556 [Colletotrichum karsti]KAF9877980.1 hypothetical protein CkaCkLH20_04556 [Colletotrichum karsti]